MKKQISLSIAAPCSEKWSNFTPTMNGGFCNSCNKNVIDFTKMSDREIVDFFKNKPAATCGKFLSGQLKAYPNETISGNFSGSKWLQAGLLSFLMVALSKEGSANNISSKTKTEIVHYQDREDEKEAADQTLITINGLVVDEYKQPLPGVTVYLKGESLGTFTDVNGQFVFPKELNVGDILVFSYIGFETREYVVPKNAPAVLEIPLIMLEMELMGEVAIDELYTDKPSAISVLWHKIKGMFL